MATNQLFQFVIKERQCSQSKLRCSHNCASCNCYTDPNSAYRFYTELADILKARKPELMFIDELSVLHEILERGTDSDGTSN